MDIYCPKCGEPCDTGEFLYMEEHWGQKIEPDEARRRFYKFGCAMLFSNGKRNCGSERQQKENKRNHLKMKKCALDIFLKENPHAKDEDLLAHPISGEQMRMEEIRTESYTTDYDLEQINKMMFLADASDALHDLMGDDLDGIASMLGDF